MNDLISRQAAIDLVRDVCDAIMSICGSHYDPETEDEVYDDIREVDAILKCNKEIRIALEHLQPAQPDLSEYSDKLWRSAYERGKRDAHPEPQWIPCSERLPENDERVLATTAWGEVTIAERVYPSINDTCWFIHDGNTNATIDDVIAWTSLPSLYQAEGGNE